MTINPFEKPTGNFPHQNLRFYVVVILAIAAIGLLCVLEPRLAWAGLAMSVMIAVVAIALGVSHLPASSHDTPGVWPDSELQPEQTFSQLDLAQAVADPLIVFDRQGVVVYANPAALAAFDPVSPGTMLQLRFRAPELQGLIETALHRGDFSAQVEYNERIPEERAYRVSATRLDTGHSLYALLFRDHSEARRIDRMRADFIANASHELRTPLASISGFIETLRGPARNDEAARERFLTIMQEQAGRMARLLDDLLSLSRVEMKAMLKPGEHAGLGEILQTVIATSEPRAKDAGIAIETQMEDGAFEVRGDRDELIQVFENLVENAFKYGRSGARITVSLRHEVESGQTGIAASVRDYGAGISPEHIPRITERFYRIDAEASRNQKGTGLGLAIVKHIVTRHRARLIVRSKIGEGTDFTVFFPDDSAKIGESV